MTWLIVILSKGKSFKVGGKIFGSNSWLYFCPNIIFCKVGDKNTYLKWLIIKFGESYNQLIYFYHKAHQNLIHSNDYMTR
jgi:hypothetical protein